jgi:mannose-6-phosphate isomerase class I
MELAKNDSAFAESLNDAICLYLQRADSGLEKAETEFEPLLAMLTELKRQHSGQHLMAWIDRHRTMSHPTDAQEKRFALAIWSLMNILPPDSRLFVDWWMERVKLHRGDWLASHFDPKFLVRT